MTKKFNGARLGIGALVTALAGVAGVAGALAAGDGDWGPPDRTDTVSKDCVNSVTNQKEGTFTYDGVVAAFPPNHKYVSATITLTDEDQEPATDGVKLVVTGSHDQVTDGEEIKGSGNTPAETDAVGGVATGTGSATVPVKFRAERSGQDKTGREYTFDTTGSTVDTGTSTCKPVKFTATVPHDMRDGL